GEIDRWKRAKKPKDVDRFVLNDEAKIKWSSRLKETFVREVYGEFDPAKIRTALYRPFSKRVVFFDAVLNHRRALFPLIFPQPASEQENRVIALTGVAPEKPFMTLVGQSIVDLHLVGAGAGSQCFPYYVYDEDGTNRRENITDWALEQFRTHYGDKKI